MNSETAIETTMDLSTLGIEVNTPEPKESYIEVMEAIKKKKEEKERVARLGMKEISDIVEDYFGATIGDCYTRKRTKDEVKHRQISMYFIKEHIDSSLKLIGHHFDKRDHSTVIHAIKSVEDFKSFDRAYKKDIDFLTQIFNAKYKK